MTEKKKKKVEPPSTIQETLFEKYIDKTVENKHKKFKQVASEVAILDMRKDASVKKALNKLKKRKLDKKVWENQWLKEVLLKPKPPRKPQKLEWLEKGLWYKKPTKTA